MRASDNFDHPELQSSSTHVLSCHGNRLSWGRRIDQDEREDFRFHHGCKRVVICDLWDHINTNKIVEKSEIKKIFSQGTQRHKFIGIDVDKKNNKIAITYLIAVSYTHL